MKAEYRGHEIEVTREKCLGGWSQLYYSIFRISDGYECTSGHQDSDETVRDMVTYMKQRIDNELAEDDPWGEREESDGWGETIECEACSRAAGGHGAVRHDPPACPLD